MVRCLRRSPLNIKSGGLSSLPILSSWAQQLTARVFFDSLSAREAFRVLPVLSRRILFGLVKRLSLGWHFPPLCRRFNASLLICQRPLRQSIRQDPSRAMPIWNQNDKQQRKSSAYCYPKSFGLLINFWEAFQSPIVPRLESPVRHRKPRVFGALEKATRSKRL
jgi:hypothetical protein